MRLGFVQVLLASNESLDAECLRVKAKAITRAHVLAMEDGEVVEVSKEWIKTSVRPVYLDAVKTENDHAGASFLGKLSPPDDILACLGVVKQYKLGDEERQLLVLRCYDQFTLLKSAYFM